MRVAPSPVTKDEHFPELVLSPGKMQADNDWFVGRPQFED